MPPDPVLRELVEQPQFSKTVDELSQFARRDDVIRGALWAIATNAEVFSVVEGFRNIRMFENRTHRIWP